MTGQNPMRTRDCMNVALALLGCCVPALLAAQSGVPQARPIGRAVRVTTAPVLHAGVFDQAKRDQPADRGVKRAGAHAKFIAGAAGNVENDAVAVAILACEREQDVELLRRQGEEITG